MAQKTRRMLKKEWKEALWVALLAFGVFALAIRTAHAGYLPDDWGRFLPGGLKTPVEGSGEDLATSFIRNAVVIIRYVVGGVALIMGGIYSLSLVFSRGDEEKISQQRKNFLWMLLGFVILIVSENIANIFNPERATSDQIVDFDAARDQLRDIVDYMKWILGSVAVLFMTISGVRLVTSGSEEEEITKQKANLAWSLIGLLLVLLADSIVNAFYLIGSNREFLAPGPDKAITEISGVIRLILAFLGPMAIVFTLFAGYVYLTAMESEERSEQGKRMIIGGVIGIVLIYSAYALVNTITSERLAWIFNPLVA